jgi:purine-binding chemotaxis protein CheW
VVPAVNLRVRFGFERAPYDVRSRLLIVQSGGRSVGLVVDEAREFAHIPASAVQPPQESMTELSGQYIEGLASLAGRLIVVLNLGRLLEFSGPLVPA